MILKSKIIFFFFLAFLVGFLLGLKILIYQKNQQSRVMINSQTIYVDVVKTEKAITQGLSSQDKMDKNRGMLFIFNKSGNYIFWMKGMKFNLDFVFINGESIVDLVEDVSFPKQGEQPQTVWSKKEFDKVLEINAGRIKKLNLRIRDKIQYLW